MILALPKLVQNLGQFERLQKSLEVTPTGAVATFLLALNFYAENEEEGKRALKKALGGTALNNGEMLKNEEVRLHEQLKRYPYLSKVYFQKAEPANGYQVPPENLSLKFKDFQYDDDNSLKLFIYSSGADSPRPVRVVRVGNVWKVEEFSSLLMGVREPK